MSKGFWKTLWSFEEGGGARAEHGRRTRLDYRYNMIQGILKEIPVLYPMKYFSYLTTDSFNEHMSVSKVIYCYVFM